MSPTTLFAKLNKHWNAEPNAPDPHVFVDGSDVILDFYLNPFQFPAFAEDQRGQLRFTEVWRYRLGFTNDEGWYRGQCRFSGIAPAWGEFYEVTGDLLMSKCPNDWMYLKDHPEDGLRHFLFYFRDETFECDARAWRSTLGRGREPKSPKHPGQSLAPGSEETVTEFHPFRPPLKCWGRL